MTGSLYFLDNSRSDEQTQEMLGLETQGICIFCPEHIETHKQVLHRTDCWVVTSNDYPYEGTSLHLLVSPTRHVEDILDLPPLDLADFWHALAWVRDHYKLTYYGLGNRNGLAEKTGATIRHIHVHVIVGDPNADEPVRLKLSS